MRQQFQYQVKTYFISDPPPEPVVEEDPDIQYITEEYFDPEFEEPVEEEEPVDEEIVIKTSWQKLQTYPSNNVQMVVSSIISFFGSMFLTTFLISMLT